MLFDHPQAMFRVCPLATINDTMAYAMNDVDEKKKMLMTAHPQ